MVKLNRVLRVVGKTLDLYESEAGDVCFCLQDLARALSQPLHLFTGIMSNIDSLGGSVRRDFYPAQSCTARLHYVPIDVLWVVLMMVSTRLIQDSKSTINIRRYVKSHVQKSEFVESDSIFIIDTDKTESSMKSVNLFVEEYKNRPRKCRDMRMGQYFMCYYVHYSGHRPHRPYSNPELFYEKDDKKALAMIREYLTNHCYIDELPWRIDPCSVNAAG